MFWFEFFLFNFLFFLPLLGFRVFFLVFWFLGFFFRYFCSSIRPGPEPGQEGHLPMAPTIPGPIYDANDI